MAAFGSSVAAVTQLLNGAVFLPADEHASKLNTQQMSAALMARGTRALSLCHWVMRLIRSSWRRRRASG